VEGIATNFPELIRCWYPLQRSREKGQEKECEASGSGTAHAYGLYHHQRSRLMRERTGDAIHQPPAAQHASTCSRPLRESPPTSMLAQRDRTLTPHAVGNHPLLSHMSAFFEAKPIGVGRVASAKSLFRLPNHFHLRPKATSQFAQCQLTNGWSSTFV